MSNFTCCHCGETKRDDYDYPNPYPYDKRRKICDDCYDEVFKELCVICHEHFDKKDRGFAFIKEPSPCGTIRKLRAGYYQILDFPIVMGAMLGPSWFVERNMKFIGKPKGTEMSSESGHICPMCVGNAGVYNSKTPAAVFDLVGRMKNSVKEIMRGVT